MKFNIMILILLADLLVSCYKPYDANIEADKKILVVNGLITNEKAAYNVSLSYATPFDSINSGLPISSAKIYITDNMDNIYFFAEKEYGNYISDSLQFTGQPGNIYILHIITPEGDRYESGPQKLFPEMQPESLYAEFDYQETLSKINGLKVLSHGANILTDIHNESDTIPRFRFTSNLVKQYFYFICPITPPGQPPLPCFYFYCWQTTNDNPDINLTGGEYSANSASVKRHSVGFLDDELYLNGIVYGIGEKQPDLSYEALGSINQQLYLVMNRILYLNQYTLNNESYYYYKKMDEQLRSDGKLFDPIAAQLIGNIKCISDPDRKAFGLFEASSVSRTSCIVNFRNLVNAQPSLTMVPYILPPEPTGCWINKVPPFWIY
jgi:hypothetical protein